MPTPRQFIGWCTEQLNADFPAARNIQARIQANTRGCACRASENTMYIYAHAKEESGDPMVHTRLDFNLRRAVLDPNPNCISSPSMRICIFISVLAFSRTNTYHIHACAFPSWTLYYYTANEILLFGAGLIFQLLGKPHRRRRILWSPPANCFSPLFATSTRRRRLYIYIYHSGRMGMCISTALSHSFWGGERGDSFFINDFPYNGRMWPLVLFVLQRVYEGFIYVRGNGNLKAARIWARGYCQYWLVEDCACNGMILLGFHFKIGCRSLLK